MNYVYRAFPWLCTVVLVGFLVYEYVRPKYQLEMLVNQSIQMADLNQRIADAQLNALNNALRLAAEDTTSSVYQYLHGLAKKK